MTPKALVTTIVVGAMKINLYGESTSPLCLTLNFRIMTVQQGFTNVLSYAAGVEQWVNNSLPQPLEFTFVSDFAIADWFSEDDVHDTYRRVKESWLSDYVAFTEVVIALNMLSWANHALIKQGFEDREKFVKLYAELYDTATTDFYKKYGNDKEACDHFYRMTD